MSYGANREVATCADCGHPSMAHLGGGCYCGCPRATRLAPPAFDPDRNAPVQEFIDFIHLELSESERDRLMALLAATNGVAPPSPRTHRAATAFIVRTFTKAETSRYLAELRRRLVSGEPLLKR